MKKLGGLLESPRSAAREIVDKIVQDVAALSDDVRPARYDLAALRRVIGERLRTAGSGQA